MSKLVRNLILLFVPLLLCNPSASRAELVRLSIKHNKRHSSTKSSLSNWPQTSTYRGLS